MSRPKPEIFLNEMRAKVNENARLAILSRRNAVYIHDFESNDSVRLRSITGQHRPAHATAEGLCILAGLRAPALEAFLSEPLQRRTQHTMTSPEELTERIKRVKRMGYAIEDEECDLGTRAVAAPVYQADRRVVAAIGIAGPRIRLRKRDFPQLAETVMGYAQRLSERLGYEFRPTDLRPKQLSTMPTIRLAGNDTTFDCAPGDTILRAALRAGVGMSYSCNVGSCGNCRFELIDGEVTHLRANPPGWTDKDRARNRWLGCQAQPGS